MSQRIVAKTAMWNADRGTWTFTFGEDVTLYAGDVIVIKGLDIDFQADVDVQVLSLHGVVFEVENFHGHKP